MDATYVIKRPMVTEKTTWESDARNRFSFVVDTKATKPQIQKAIEELYAVRVESVATQIRKGETFRTRYGVSKKRDWKEATVQLHQDDRIELF
ncbi:MAG: 50S ribosomal protein L23 [Phycisphaeraceae bacterium]|nr:50S ribosomal protein L23 [Phycisphaeraceae bacterium]